MSTQTDYGVLFPTSVVGSMPRSDFIRELVASEVSLQPRQAQALDAAVAYVVGLQEGAGLDVVTDGEWRRASYSGVSADLAHGFEVGRNPADGRPWTIVTGELAPKDAGFIAREIEFLKSITSRKIKATLPAPAL